MEDELLDMNTGVEMPDVNSTMGDITTDLESEYGSSLPDAFNSGFDAEHPLPTVRQLENAGFNHDLAEQIVHGYDHVYSEKELFHCLYECEDPAQAYNDMMDAKAHAAIARSQALRQEIEETCFGSSAGLDDNTSIYNNGEENNVTAGSTEEENEYGSCDCRSECKYNTGESYKYSNYGYSD